MRYTHLALVLLLAPAAASAQQGPVVAAGVRVRVMAPSMSPRPQVGAVIAVRGDTLMVRGADPSPTPWAVPLGRIEQLEVSRGRSRGRAAAIGAGIGLAAGGLIGAGLGQGAQSSDCSDCLGAEFGGATGAGVGLVLGAVIGAAIGRERWERVPLPTRVGVMPQ